MQYDQAIITYQSKIKVPRRARIEEPGFYHVINRGVERRDVFLDDNDRDRFIEIIDESADVYHFIMHSFCLMNNHYHFLLETTNRNLSLLMRQINSKYSIYFNKRYKRIGPLWQGRFKSWYIYDESYLFSLIKYIEYNPVKAEIVQEIGGFKYASSSLLSSCPKRKIVMRCLNLELLLQLNQSAEFLGMTKDIISDKDREYITELHQASFKGQGADIVRSRQRPLSDYNLLDCDIKTRNKNIVKAVYDGYRQSELADYLSVSNVLTSKVLKQHMIKQTLFERLKMQGVFWSYSKSITYEQIGDDTLCEMILKYAGFEDIKVAFDVFGLKAIKKIWLERLIDDKRFIRLNLFIARVLFSMNVESSYFKNISRTRYEKLRLLAG